MWRAASSAVRPHMPMPPRPPALLTAVARAGVVIIPIGASMIGNLRFSRWVRGFDGHIVPSRSSCRIYDSPEFAWQDSDFSSTVGKGPSAKGRVRGNPRRSLWVSDRQLSEQLQILLARRQSEGSVIQASSARSIQLENPSFFSCLLQGLPTGGNPRHEGLAPLALQNRFACGIVRIDGDEGLSDLLDQHRIQVAVRGKAAVAVARAGPDDPEDPGRQNPLCLQALDGSPAHRTGIVLAPTNPLHDIALIGTGLALAFVIEAADSQIMRRIEP